MLWRRPTNDELVMVAMVIMAMLLVVVAFDADAKTRLGHGRLDASGNAYPAGSLNDLSKTPGDVLTKDKKVICGQHTGTVRNVSKSVKTKAFALYDITNKTGWCEPGGCEVDHLISLELGGSNDIKNLWPQPYAGIEWNAHVKDKIENRLHALICKGVITPEQAQRAIAYNWIVAYQKYYVKAYK